MDSLMDKSLKDFNSLLKSSEPAPGGGSAAALSGMLGAALTMMVFNLSVNKKAYEALDNKIKQDMAENFEAIVALNSDLACLADEDTKAFNKFMEAMKLPKETDEQKKLREEALQKAGRYALEVPLATAEKCLRILKNQAAIGKYGNKNAVSDIGVGALMALAGLEGAVLNVKINLPGIKDESLKKQTERLIEAYTREGAGLKDEIMRIVNGRIG
ncbi:MAG: cyclodeaminase/cyclohydrolase family protein [Bacillota bacterium]|nr:cyclodeaminase/cyclohydrolase family protein [Bacillota bacterium]